MFYIIFSKKKIELKETIWPTFKICLEFLFSFQSKKKGWKSYSCCDKRNWPKFNNGHLKYQLLNRYENLKWFCITKRGCTSGKSGTIAFTSSHLNWKLEYVSTLTLSIDIIFQTYNI